METFATAPAALPKTKLAQRVLLAADFTEFRTLSGDLNPLHEDEFYCQDRGLPEPIFYGCGSILWALRALGIKPEDLPLTSLEVEFLQPLYKDQICEISCQSLSATDWFLQIKSAGHRLLSARLQGAATAEAKWWASALIEVSGIIGNRHPGAGAMMAKMTLHRSAASVLAVQSEAYAQNSFYEIHIRSALYQAAVEVFHLQPFREERAQYHITSEKLKGHSVLLLGGSQGIGFHLGKELGSHGAQVTAVSRRPAQVFPTEVAADLLAMADLQSPRLTNLWTRQWTGVVFSYLKPLAPGQSFADQMASFRAILQMILSASCPQWIVLLSSTYVDASGVEAVPVDLSAYVGLKQAQEAYLHSLVEKFPEVRFHIESIPPTRTRLQQRNRFGRLAEPSQVAADLRQKIESWS